MIARFDGCGRSIACLNAAPLTCFGAPVVKLVDALDSKSSSARSAGSIPARGTTVRRCPREWCIVGRGKRIRTSGPCLPKTVLYQAELFPDRCGSSPRAEWQDVAISERSCADQPRAAIMSSTATNFSRGAPSRARAISASSIFFQSRKVTTSTPRRSSRASSPGRP